jgi:hypothetical protein
VTLPRHLVHQFFWHFLSAHWKFSGVSERISC